MSKKRFHFIAMGGAVMHQLALHLHNLGNIVTGSDDIIFDPAYTNLKKHHILPDEFGWFPNRIHEELDAIILGMHAKENNPELLKAKSLGLKIYSFPEFIYEQSKDKKRIVIAGSHGKTTTTSMVMHVLNNAEVKFDYLVGAEIKGFDYVVKTSEDATCIVIEGDEYLTSPLDLRSKFLHYLPHIAVITGIAWDHINVFPTYAEYVDTFRKFMHSVQEKIFYYHDDEDLRQLAQEITTTPTIQYLPFDAHLKDDGMVLTFNNKDYPIKIFGKHNMANLSAAYHICKEVGINDEDFFHHIQSFEGANKRLELLYDDETRAITLYKDFAHAPSKVVATVRAIQERYPNRKLIVALELHTYSSLQENFIGQYKDSLSPSHVACVYVDKENLKIKNRSPIDPAWLKKQFGDETIFVANDAKELSNWLNKQLDDQSVILMMSSGHWGGFDPKSIL